MILKLLWKLIYRSRTLRLRVYRLVEERSEIVVWSIVYEDIERKQFISNFSFSEQIASIDPDVTDPCDARQAIMGLEDVPLLMDRDRWQVLTADSIEGAVHKANVLAKELYEERAKSASVRVPLTEARHGTLRAHARVKENPPEDTRLAAQLDSRFKRRAGLRRQQLLRWVPVESTASGCLCQVLLIDGREEHQIP